MGWVDNVHLHFVTYMMLRIVPHIYDATLLCGVGWGGVG